MASTALVRKHGTDPAITDDELAEFIEQYPILDPDSEIMEAITANVGEDGGIAFSDLDRVTVPPGGGSAWAIPDLEEGEVHVKELTGIVLFWEASRALFLDPDTTGEPPACSSRDGKHPIPTGLFGEQGDRADDLPVVPVLDKITKQPTGETARLCEHCPMAQWGSHLKGGGGKACKESRLLYLMRQGEALPTIVSVSPTSLKAIRSFLLKVAAQRRLHYSDFVIGLTLKVVDDGKNKYSTIIPRIVDVLKGSNKRGALSGAVALVRQAGEDFRQAMDRAGVTGAVIESRAPAAEDEVADQVVDARPATSAATDEPVDGVVGAP